MTSHFQDGRHGVISRRKVHMQRQPGGARCIRCLTTC